MMKREQIETKYEDLIFLDGYDDAIVGVAERAGEMCVLYSAEKILEKLMADEMSRDDAVDFFYFNINSAYLGEATPAFLWTE
jgi:hypothetical protein